jgi:hypothetical protein
MKQKMAEQKANIFRRKHQVDMYKELTATSLSNAHFNSHGEPVWDCTVTNATAGASTTFRLEPAVGDGGIRLIEYTPIENAELLSPILHGSVQVVPDQLPAFLKDVFNSTFPEHDPSERSLLILHLVFLLNFKVR